MGKEKSGFQQTAIFALVSSLVYALVLITIDNFFNDAIAWNKIVIKAVIFCVFMGLILSYRQSKKNK